MLTQFSEFGGPSGIRDALLTGDQRLSIQHLSLLMQLAPTPDEIKALKLYRGPVAELSPPEQFLMVLSSVPRLPSKVGALLFRGQYAQLFGDASGGLEALRCTCSQLRSSARLRRVLATLLAAGNLLNAGTHRGNAQALKLESLLKVGDVKVTTPIGGGAAAAAAGKGTPAKTPPGAAIARHGGVSRTPSISPQKTEQEENGGGDKDSNGAESTTASVTAATLPPVRSLLEFVAWKVYVDVVESGEVPGSRLLDVARAGYLTEDLNSLGDAVRRMQSGEFILIYLLLLFCLLACLLALYLSCSLWQRSFILHYCTLPSCPVSDLFFAPYYLSLCRCLGCVEGAGEWNVHSATGARGRMC